MSRYKFIGTFNWYGEVHRIYTVAQCKDVAFDNIVTRLSDILKVSRYTVLNYFLDVPDSWKISRT